MKYVNDNEVKDPYPRCRGKGPQLKQTDYPLTQNCKDSLLLPQTFKEKVSLSSSPEILSRAKKRSAG
ncbi:hypothetical protein DHB64_15895 [Antarcticibacterium sp. W02-3]|nr:hypothetical protein [Antarcticibacterium sp. W02-3]